MSVLAAVQQAAPLLGIRDIPDALYGSTDATAVFLQSVVDEAAQGIAQD